MAELYPFKFKPILKEKIWGGCKLGASLHKENASDKTGESWEISGVEDNVSVVINGYLAGNNLQELAEVYMSDLLGDKVFEKYGDNFPLLIKFIDANDYLSIQVHPDDKLAQDKHESKGKTEMWYVLEAEPDAELITGFNKTIDKETYLKHLQSKTLKDILNIEKVARGDVFYIPAGRVHAIGAGVLLAEIQQTSDITYRIYDWDRKDADGNTRELHTDQALDAIDFNAYDDYKTKYREVHNQTSKIVESNYFITNVLMFDTPVEKEYIAFDSFVIFICVDGKFSVDYGETEKVTIEKGETLLLPAMLNNVTLIPHENARILEVFAK
jgi:mannose-6-phosphate isomerase